MTDKPTPRDLTDDNAAREASLSEAAQTLRESEATQTLREKNRHKENMARIEMEKAAADKGWLDSIIGAGPGKRVNFAMIVAIILMFFAGLSGGAAIFMSGVASETAKTLAVVAFSALGAVVGYVFGAREL